MADTYVQVPGVERATELSLAMLHILLTCSGSASRDSEGRKHRRVEKFVFKSCPIKTRIKPEILRHRREDVSLVSRKWSSRIASGIPSGSVLELNKDWVGRDSPTSRLRSNGRGGFGSVGVTRKAISPNHPEIGCDSMSTTSGRSTAAEGWQLPPQLGVSVPAGRIMRVTARIVTPQRCRARFSSEAPAWATCSRTNLGPGACEAELRLAAPMRLRGRFSGRSSWSRSGRETLEPYRSSSR